MSEGAYLPVVGSGVRQASTGRAVGVPAEVVDEFLDLVRTGYGKYKAADLLGFRWDEIAEAIERDDELEREFEHAQEVRLDEVEEAMYGTAISGNVQAQKFLLTNRRAGKWGEGPVLVQRVQATHDPSEDADQLESARARERFRDTLMERILNAREMAQERMQGEDEDAEDAQ